MTHVKHRSSSSQPSAAKCRRSNCDGFTRVIRELEAASGSGARIDPFVERLRQCPEAFTAGEMVGKMFNALKHGEDDSEGEERYLPPAGVVMPLV
jgi:hypothetical protein